MVSRPGAGARAVVARKQLQYSLLRSLMGRRQDFWQLTRDGLIYAGLRVDGHIQGGGACLAGGGSTPLDRSTVVSAS